MHKEIDKSKFVLVQQDEVIYDQKIETEAIGYFKDAWIRFKRNRLSLIAFYILLVLIIMAIIGPKLNKYEFTDRDVRLADLTPKIKGLEKLGIFDGTKILVNRNIVQFFDPNLPEGTIIGDFFNEKTTSKCDGMEIPREDGLGKKCIKNGKEIPYIVTTFVDVKVDYYKYVNYINSYAADKYLTLTEANFDKIDKEILTSEPIYINTEYVTYNTIDKQGIKVTLGEFNKVDPSKIVGEPVHSIEKQVKVHVNYFRYLGYADGETPYFWFGTDPQGRDLFTLLWLGARTSFMVAFSVAFINIIIGVIMGAISGYYGGKTDLFLQRLFEIIGGIPFLALITLLILRFGSALWVIILAFTLTDWIGISRTVRAQFYRYKNREYVLAARSLGAKDLRLMSRHILPNALGTIITSTILFIPGTIFAESTFSFLGIINYGSMSSVGRLLSLGQAEMQTSFHILLFPAIFISLLMLSFNMFGNGLRDAFNPSLRGVE